MDCHVGNSFRQRKLMTKVQEGHATITMGTQQISALRDCHIPEPLIESCLSPLRVAVRCVDALSRELARDRADPEPFPRLAKMHSPVSDWMIWSRGGAGSWRRSDLPEVLLHRLLGLRETC